jgi:hypothetical protein
MELRAFAVCRQCSEVFPSFCGCPNCDGDEETAKKGHSGRIVSVASAAESPERQLQAAPSHTVRATRVAQWKPVVAIVSVSVVLSTLIAVLAQA